MLSVFMYIGMYMKDDSVNTFLLLGYTFIFTFAFECYCAEVHRLLMFENLDKIQRSLSETYLSETYSAIACIKHTSTETIMHYVQ